MRYLPGNSLLYGSIYDTVVHEFHAFFIRAGVKEAIIKCQLN